MFRIIFASFFFTSFSTVAIAEESCRSLAADYIDRYDDVFGAFINLMDVSGSVQERTASDLKIFRIADVFPGPNETFLGFGIPNLYLVVPNEAGGYSKFAAKSLKRAPAKYENTRGWAQSGVLLRFKDIPEATVAKLRSLIQEQEGNRHWTCVNANCRVLAAAGFSSGGNPLEGVYFPYQFARQIMKEGLQLDGRDVEFDVIKTTPLPLQAFTMAVIKAELMTPQRHALRALKPWFEKFGVSAVWAFSKRQLGKAVLSLTGRQRSEQETEQIAEYVRTLPGDQHYIDDINLTYSRSSKLGILLRILWGRHSIYEARRSEIKIDEFLPQRLKEFPQQDPSFSTRLKQKFLFSPTVVSFIRSKLAASRQELGPVSEKTIYDQIDVHTETRPNMHNIVITGEKITIARLHVRNKFVDWVLTKHVLMSGYDPDVRFAGELWKDADGTIVVNCNSGTYRPSRDALERAVEYLRAVFPNVQFRVANC